MPNKKWPVFALLAAGLVAMFAAPRPYVDLAFVKGKGGHALLSLGSASIRLAFDIGQKCSNSNSCAGSSR